MPKKKNHLGWIVGSVTLCAAAVFIVPPLINKISAASYRASNQNLDDEDLFPEPIVERKSEAEDEEAENND